jgi:hypothetical protein
MKEEVIKLPKENTNDFLSRLDTCDFWNLKANEENLGFDGVSWVMEGVKDGRYHIVVRWSPEAGKYREAALFLVKLANLSLPNIY